jgi:hypothetical protein
MNWLIREREVHMVSSLRAVGAPSRWGTPPGRRIVRAADVPSNDLP